MNWLYILFTLVMDTPKVPIVPTGTVVPTNALETKLIEIPFFRPSSSGMDERFPLVSIENDEKIRLYSYYLEQIRELESTKTIEGVYPIIQEVLPLYEISPGRITAGGLMDDWERNI
jgi:hypothetical protein